MRDHHDREIAAQTFDRVKNPLLVMRVEAVGGLVQNQQARMAQHRARVASSSSTATGETPSTRIET